MSTFRTTFDNVTLGYVRKIVNCLLKEKPNITSFFLGAHTIFSDTAYRNL